MKTVFTYAVFCCSLLIVFVCNAQTSVIRERATTAYRTDSAGLYPSDSTYYKYSGSRGGFPIWQYNTWQYSGKYDTCYYTYKTNRDSKYYPISRLIDTFDSHNNLLGTLYQSYDTASGKWTNSSLALFTYDAHNNQLSALYQSWNSTSGIWMNSTLYGYTYDANNNMLTDTTSTWISGVHTYSSLYLYAYDTHNDLTESLLRTYSSGSWNNLIKQSYFLNAAYKPDSVLTFYQSGTSWNKVDKELYTYDSVYNALTDSQYQWNTITSVWNTGALHIYTYSGSDQLSDEYRLGDHLTAWQNYSYTSNSYDANHNMVDLIYEMWDTVTAAYRNDFKENNIFNTDNKADTMKLSVWDTSASAWNFNYMTVYYYGTVASGVNNMVQHGGNVHLYPSPANGYLNIDIKWKTAQAATLAIYDMNGRLYRQWAADASLNYHSNIPTSGLPAGNYILKVRGDAGQVAEQFSIVH
ncbi:MAG: T9SS type A sorting domain-containing protein [Flavipsychrobacter sp.]